VKPSDFTKDVARVHAALVVTQDESTKTRRLVTRKGCKIYIPVRFTERGLATVGVEIIIVGICAIVVEDKYFSTMMVNALVRIEPNATNRVVFDGDEYFEFVFNPGATVIPSLSLVKQNTLVYRIFDEFINKGRIPWYTDYPTLAKLFDTAKKHAGANIGGDHEVTELIISMISRNPGMRSQYYRQIIDKPEDLQTNPPIFSPLKSVIDSATNTTNKLAGSYMQEGIISALGSPSERTERIEALLRL
jgi:hypothetical protein